MASVYGGARMSRASSMTRSQVVSPEPTIYTTSRSGAGRSRSRGRTLTAASNTGIDQEIICAISESRGISPIVGLAFVNLSTTEAVLCQVSDDNIYTRTGQKLMVYEPSEVLFMTSAAEPKSKLFLNVENNLPSIRITCLDRKVWSESTGLEYIDSLAIYQDLPALKLVLEGQYYAICCFAAAMQHVESQYTFRFPANSLRIKYEPSESTMMIDAATVNSLELVRNVQNAKSKDCLFGILNHTVTAMGSRRLKNSILQPSTDREILQLRYEAVEELQTKQDVLIGVRQGLRHFLDLDRVLTAITITPKQITLQHYENSINNIIMLKQCVKAVSNIREVLQEVTSDLLQRVLSTCSPDAISPIHALIDETINEDTMYQKQPLDLRNQRTYAVRAGTNGLLDVARQTFKEANMDAIQLVTDIGLECELRLELKYENARQYYIRIDEMELHDREVPDIFINLVRKRNKVECQTMELLKLNQKIADAHNEVLDMSDESISDLTEQLRGCIAPLFKISEAIGLLDMIASFAQTATLYDYVRPELTDTLAIQKGRHPIIERIQKELFIANDVYASDTSRFQIITGCNMSGKSTYIRSVALLTIMAQLGSFIPASYASIRVVHQLFTRISVDNSIEANVSTFSSEMREIAFILNNIDKRSLAIVDELGRGTSTRDGLCIAIAIAEALVGSKALVWFATHFRDLAQILSERSGVVNMHLSTNMPTEQTAMRMLYQVAPGWEKAEHYGIALAKTMGFPPLVIEVAERVSTQIREKAERKKASSKTIALARRRRLLLTLGEQLKHTEESKMEGEPLRIWLLSLQTEFIQRMAAIDAEIARGEEEESEVEVRIIDRAATITNETRSTSLLSDIPRDALNTTTYTDHTDTDDTPFTPDFLMSGALQGNSILQI